MRQNGNLSALPDTALILHMASMKNTIVLGCFMVLCTVLFIVFNPNRWQLQTTESQAIRIDSLTGKVQLHTEDKNKLVNTGDDRPGWVTLSEGEYIY